MVNQEDIQGNWFSSEVSHTGRGRAEFLAPLGTVEGTATVRFDEFGQETVTMEIEDVDTKEPLTFGLMQLFSGTPVVRHPDGSAQMGFGGISNTCSSLMVESERGVFKATRGIHFGYKVGIFGGPGGTLTFHLLRSTFEPHEPGQARYWVLPLSNFISQFTRQQPLLLDHPLRIYSLAEGAEQSPRVRTLLNDFLIAFEQGGGLGFIEPLPDYTAREENLKTGRERQAVTALMVGEVNSRGIDDDELDAWFPLDYLRVLSLATGTSVGAPWIEFRDGQGHLIRRTHVRVGMAPFTKGHRPVDELVHSGVGYMLSRFESASERGRSYVNVTLKHVAEAASYSGSVEDRFIYLCRALEVLCDHQNLKTQHLTGGLDPAQKQIVTNALKTAQAEIQQAADSAAAAGKHNQSRALTKIADRARANPANVDRDFGLAVTELLCHYGLPDADIVDAHYLTSPRVDGIKKGRHPIILPRYRHSSGIFSIRYEAARFRGCYQNQGPSPRYPSSDRLWADYYDGTYQPPVVKLSTSVRVNWVDRSTSAVVLGYTGPALNVAGSQ